MYTVTYLLETIRQQVRIWDLSSSLFLPFSVYKSDCNLFQFQGGEIEARLDRNIQRLSNEEEAKSMKGDIMLKKRKN